MMILVRFIQCFEIRITFPPDKRAYRKHKESVRVLFQPVVHPNQHGLWHVTVQHTVGREEAFRRCQGSWKSHKDSFALGPETYPEVSVPENVGAFLRSSQELCVFQSSLHIILFLYRYGVAVQDFGKSWTSGLAFLAVIKSIDPSLVDMRRALLRSPRENIEEAFRTAHYSLGIARLLEPEGTTAEHLNDLVFFWFFPHARLILESSCNSKSNWVSNSSVVKRNISPQT